MATKEVVVGVDGSSCGDAALAWAQDYAQSTGATLVLLTAWQWPTSYGQPINWSTQEWDPAVDAHRLLEKVAAGLTLPPDRVRLEVVQGSASIALVRASESADALVVGTRGHGAVAGAVLGSVSTYCVHHAHCPVVVVR